MIMKTKNLITFEKKEAVLDALYDLFTDGCPICISDIGGIEDSAYYLPNKYRDTLLNSLHSHEEDVVNDTVYADRNFILDFIKISPFPTPIYRIHNLHSTIEVWCLGSEEISKACVRSIVQFIFDIEPSCYEHLERRIASLKNQITRIKEQSLFTSSIDAVIRIQELENEIELLTEEMEDTIKEFEDFVNNSFAIEKYDSYEEIVEKEFNKFLTQDEMIAEKERWIVDGILYNPHMKLRSK